MAAMLRISFMIYDDLRGISETYAFVCVYCAANGERTTPLCHICYCVFAKSAGIRRNRIYGHRIYDYSISEDLYETLTRIGAMSLERDEKHALAHAIADACWSHEAADEAAISDAARVMLAARMLDR